jgi:hypothetical protein
MLLPLLAYGDFSTGIHLSLGQLHYSFKDFASPNGPGLEGKPNDLFLGFSLYFKNRFEVNVVYNRASGEISRDYRLVNYDKDGFGLDVGKVLSLDLFKKGSLSLSADFVAGLYAMVYPILNIRQTDRRTGQTEELDDPFHHQLGFYWTVRLRNLIGKKLSIDLGFKSLIPFKSNEWASSLGEDILIYKNFLTIGISF